MVTALLVFLALLAAGWIALALSPAQASTFAEQLRADTPLPDDPPLPPVTLVIPARNEGSMLPTTVASWCTQDYPDVRVVVVDDHSEDDTPAVLAAFAARFPSLTVISAEPRPDDWMGKPWALMQGVKRADGDLLLFVDADCVLHPLAVRQAVAYVRANGLDMLSLFPRPVFGSTVERVGLAGLVTILGLLFPTGRSNDPKRPAESAVASGGFILVRRAAYERIGGHRAVKAQMIEDVHLARTLKGSGAAVRTLLTPDLVTTRMYEGFADLWEGLTKNAYAGMEFRPYKFWVGMIVGVLVCVMPPFYLLAAVGCVIADPSSRAAWWAAGLSLVVNVVMAIVHGRTTRYLKLPPLYAFTMSASAALYTLIGVASAWQNHFGGGNVWKGRRYDRQMMLNAAAEPVGEGRG